MKLEFREVLRGVVGAAESAEDGYQTGSAFSFQAKATIEDLDAFEADPEHRARLEGKVDWASLPDSPPLGSSEVRLFVPRAGGRAFLYRLSFESGGTRFELRGEKRLGARPTLREITTLYVDLFQEGDQQPVARGILRVPLGEALRFGFHVRVPGRGLLRSVGPALRFFRFSQRQLREPMRNGERG
jgi:hypothetical protein